MKKVLLLLLAVSLTMTSCKKEETEEQPEATENTVKLQIDNNAEIDFKDSFSAMVLGGRLIIGAADNASGSDIQFSLDPSIATGTYTTGFLISHGVNGQAVFATAINASGESLTITTHNTNSKHLKGNFTLNFTDNNTQANRHAEGSFDITYN
jgi:hypothetical protein